MPVRSSRARPRLLSAQIPVTVGCRAPLMALRGMLPSAIPKDYNAVESSKTLFMEEHQVPPDSPLVSSSCGIMLHNLVKYIEEPSGFFVVCFSVFFLSGSLWPQGLLNVKQSQQGTYVSRERRTAEALSEGSGWVFSHTVKLWVRTVSKADPSALGRRNPHLGVLACSGRMSN